MELDTFLLLDDFQAEARAHLAKIEAAFLSGEELGGKLIDDVFRAAHSLKGTAGFFALDKIVSIAHSLENIFQQMKSGKLRGSEKLSETVLSAIDSLRSLVDDPAGAACDVDACLAMLSEYADVAVADAKKRGGKSKPSSFKSSPFAKESFYGGETGEKIDNLVKHGHKLYYINVVYDKRLDVYYGNLTALSDNINSIGGVLGSNLAEIAFEQKEGKPVEVFAESVLDLELFSVAVEIDGKYINEINLEELPLNRKDAAEPSTAEKAAEKADEKPAAQAQADHFLRLNVAVVNGLMDLSNEMILARNRLLSVIGVRRRDIAGLSPVLQDISRLSGEIQEKSMRARMQPIGVLFARFPRVIHDMSRSLGKDIRAEITGGDVATDKYILDAVSDPLTQLVKNAADHGVESPEERIAAGKERTGVITVSARLRNGFAVIEVTDDGKGMNAENLKKSAAEKGYITPDEAARMSNRDAYMLIFNAGVSTARKVTDLSGRGVGMDIVKTNVEKLGGFIDVVSEEGKGTTMRLRIPLTLSVSRSLIVLIDGTEYALPEMNVERVVRVWRGGKGKRFERVDNMLALNLHGRLLPVVSMGQMVAMAAGGDVPPINADLSKGALKCVVMRANGRTFALMVDDAKGTEETILKPLPKSLKGCGVYSGVSVLGNGSAIMIFDAEGIMRTMRIEGAEDIIEEEAAEDDNSREIIIFKGSGDETFAVELNKVSHVEVIEKSKIHMAGGSRYVNVRGQSVRVTRLSDFMPVTRREYDKEKLFLIVPKAGGGKVGFLISKIVDKVKGSFELGDGAFYSDYSDGTAAYGEEMLIFVNAEKIVAAVERGKLEQGQSINSRFSMARFDEVIGAGMNI